MRWEELPHQLRADGATATRYQDGPTLHIAGSKRHIELDLFARKQVRDVYIVQRHASGLGNILQGRKRIDLQPRLDAVLEDTLALFARSRGNRKHDLLGCASLRHAGNVLARSSDLHAVQAHALLGTGVIYHGNRVPRHIRVSRLHALHCKGPSLASADYQGSRLQGTAPI